MKKRKLDLAIISDVHLGTYGSHATELYHYLNSIKPKTLVLNGDIIDCYMLSKYNPDPRERKFGEEIIAFQQFIKVLKENVTNNIYFKEGNHEFRYEKIMIIKAPEFLGIPAFEFENVLGCKELGVEFIKDQRIVYIGKLPALHGHEIRMTYAAVNPARTLFLKTFKSGICGHLHKTSNHTEQSLDGKAISTFSTGHLGEPHPKYFPINKWNHGIARVEKNEDGDFEVINFNLNKGKLYRL